MSASMAYRAFLFCKPLTAVALSALVVVNALVVLIGAVRGRFELDAAALGATQAWVIFLYMDLMTRTVKITHP